MQQVNKDLLLCENKYFLEKSKLQNVLDFGKEPQSKPKQLKTEKVSSNVLSQVRSFLNKVKSDDPVCVNIEQEDDEEAMNSQVSDSGLENKKIQLDVLLFEQNNDTSSDDDSDDSETN